MAKTNFQTVDEYIGTFPKDVQGVLKKVRQTIHKALPGVEETISYQIPTFKLRGKYLVYFAAWKNHLSVYPIPKNVAFRKELSPYIAGKGTVKFPLDKPLPLRLIQKIAKHHLKEKL